MTRFLFAAFGLLVGSALAQGDLTSTKQAAPAPVAAPAADMSSTQPAATAPTVATPADQANAELDGLGEWLDDAGAMDRMMELMQQGKYVRKSLTVVPMLFWMGSGDDQMRRRHRPLYLAALRDSLKHMSRFDINPVSPRVLENVATTWNTEWFVGNVLRGNFTPSKREASLARLLDEKLVPDMFGNMMNVMKERAEKNLTEDQVNSFMVERAKESGVTATELNLVLNSGYVVVPVIEYVTYGIDPRGGYIAIVRGGLYLYKVNVSKDKISLVQKAKLIRVGQERVSKDGYSLLERATMGEIGLMPTTEIIMHYAIDKLLSAVMQDMRDMPEFRLLSQMTFAEKSTYQIPFSPGEIKDVHMDKFFEQVEQVQDKDGSINDEVTGWGFVNKPVNFQYPVEKIDTNVAEYIWEGYAAKGEIMSGVVTREYSRIPVDMDFRAGVAMLGIEIPADGMGGLVINPSKPNEKNTLTGIGPMFQIQTMYAPIFGVSGLDFHVNATYKYVPIDDDKLAIGGNSDNPYTGMASYDVGLGLQKKWWLGQVVPMFGADFRLGRFGLFGEGHDETYGSYNFDLYDYYIGTRVTAGVEFAITPNVRIGITGAGLWNNSFGAWEWDIDNSELKSLVEDGVDNAIDNGDAVKMSAIGFEAGAHVMVNLWPITKAFDKVLNLATSGSMGSLLQGSIAPLP